MASNETKIVYFPRYALETGDEPRMLTDDEATLRVAAETQAYDEARRAEPLSEARAGACRYRNHFIVLNVQAMGDSWMCFDRITGKTAVLPILKGELAKFKAGQIPTLPRPVPELDWESQLYTLWEDAVIRRDNTKDRLKDSLGSVASIAKRELASLLRNEGTPNSLGVFQGNPAIADSYTAAYAEQCRAVKRIEALLKNEQMRAY